MSKSPVVLFANQLFALLSQFARHRVLMCLLVMTLVMVGRLALLQHKPIPKPFVTDEFSYLLGAETFASGRWTNPPHPMWEHFETLHVLMKPTYTSKYPPGQALFLALGQKLLGNPWFGVWISFGLFAGALCWMLQNWVPPVYALIGTAITLARISVTGYWMNSYWGGAVAALGGCLLLGSLPRLVRKAIRVRDSVIASVGLLILLFSRPYEGFVVLGIGACAVLVFWRTKRRAGFSTVFWNRCAVPVVLICGTGIALHGYYNYRVTGSPGVLPYIAYFDQYQIASPWLIGGEHFPTYRHAEIENTWKGQDVEYRIFRAHPILNLKDELGIFSFYFAPLYALPVAFGLLISGSVRYRGAVILCAFVWFGLLIETAKAPHYVAASAGLLPLLVVYGLRYLRFAAKAYGPLLVLILAVLIFMQGKASEQGKSWETRVVTPRMIALSQVTKIEGDHLILVQYAPDHVDKSDECIYNSANIDASRIVWAHDMGEDKNRELIAYYHGTRKVWLFRPDRDPSKVVPYELGSNSESPPSASPK